MRRVTGESGLVEPRSRPWIWLVYLLLFGASVPWYLPAGPPILWFGLPHWVVVSLCASLGVAVFTAYVIARYWSAPEADGEPDGRADPPDDARRDEVHRR